MGTYYSLACYDCKVFLDCGKVNPVQKASGALFAAHHPEWYDNSSSLSAEVVKVDGMDAFPVTSSELLDDHSKRYPESSDPQYPKSDVQLVAEGHRGHQLYVFNDLGERPWDAYNEGDGWLAWKELKGRFQSDTYLPRNLVEDMGFKTWDEALAFINAEHERLNIHVLEEIRREFVRLVEKGQQ